MRSTLEDGLRILREAAAQAPFIRIELDEAYLRGIAAAEALPSNQTGSDKSWLWRMVRATREHYARARRVK